MSATEGRRFKGNARQINHSNINLSFLFSKSHSSNILSGFKSGVKFLATGTTIGLGLLFGAPVLCGVEGYNSYGILGGIFAPVLGIAVGSVGGSCAVVGGVLCFIWTILEGMLRTPSFLYHKSKGENFDLDSNQWFFENMENEQAKFSVSENEFFRNARISKLTEKQIFSLDVLAIQNDREARYEELPFPKKNVADRRLYDILSVEPDATQAEIKKAYYIKAKQHHPDRNAGSETSNALFQSIGQAYQILSDPKKRDQYDSEGGAMLENSSPSAVDASMIYTLLFGSEQFESLIGELKIVNHLKLSMEKSFANENSNTPYIGNRYGFSDEVVLKFRQRKRELECALNLINKLELFVCGDSEVFLEKSRREFEELSETLMGSLLVQLVGELYREKGESYLSNFSRIRSEFYKPIRGVASFWSFATHGLQLASSGLRVARIQKEAEKMLDQRRTSEPTSTPAAAFSLENLYGPNPTEERKKKVGQTTKQFTEHMLYVLWELVKQDVRSTLKNVSQRILYDQSVLLKTRKLRAEGLVLLGQEYCKKSATEKTSIDHLIQQLGRQSGLFDGSGSDAMDQREGKSEMHSFGFKDPITTEEFIQLKAKISKLSIKELKRLIISLGGDCSTCIERGDLEKTLDCILSVRIDSCNNKK